MNLRPTRVTYGGLNCIQFDGGDQPNTLVVTMHGYGAPGDDLVPIHSDIALKLGSALPNVRFVFPAAPLSLDAMGMYGGRAWWPLNMAKLMQAMEMQDFSELRTAEPPGLAEAREQLTKAIGEMLESIGGSLSKTVIGGFSQGAMLATDTALRGLQQAPAGLFLYSGTLICEHAWTTAAMRLVGTQTVQSHGSYDPILPFEGAEALYELFKVAGVPIQFFPFEGPHTLTLQALDATADMIKVVVEG